MCSSAAPSWYLPVSTILLDEADVLQRPQQAVHGALRQPQLAGEVDDAEPRERPDSSRRIAAARSIDWMFPGTVLSLLSARDATLTNRVRCVEPGLTLSNWCG